MKSFNIIILFATALFLQCSEKENPEFEKQNFTRIFDTNKFEQGYFPTDIIQTEDGGYLILAAKRSSANNFSAIYLLKVDESGKFVKDLEVDQEIVNAIGKLTYTNGKYYFIAMDASSNGAPQAKLIFTDQNLNSLTDIAITGVTYPTAAAFVDNSFLVQSYNHVDKQTVVSLLTTQGVLTKSKSFSIGAGADLLDENIINHFSFTGRKYPFEVGKMGNGLYYYNGFYNYTFSLVFTNLNADEPQGIVQGQSDDGGFSAIKPLTANQFSLARFNFGDNYILPNVNLNVNSISSGFDLQGYALTELVANAPVRIISATIAGKQTLIYASTTKSKQIGLFFYHSTSGTFMGSRYLGFSNAYEIGSLIQTHDEGLAVCGTTYLAGRFPRICLFKISKDELEKHIN